MRSTIAIASLVVLAQGCFRPGGGGCEHIPPSLVFVGEPTTLKLKFSVWGAGSGDLSKRYTRILCHYRQSGQEDFRVLPVRVLSSDIQQMEVEVEIPAQAAIGESQSLEYYFGCLFDGHTNSLPVQRVPIGKRPAASAGTARPVGNPSP